MQRAKFIHPDIVVQTVHGELPCVSDAAMGAAMADLAAVLQLAGGHATIVTERVQTGVVPNEAVTVMAVIQWQNHTQAKPQPEEHVPIPGAPAAPQAFQPPQPMMPAGWEPTPAPQPSPTVPQPPAQPNGADVAARMAAAAAQAQQQPAPVAQPGASVLPFQQQAPSAQYAMATPLPPGEGQGYIDGEDTSSIDGAEG